MLGGRSEPQRRLSASLPSFAPYPGLRAQRMAIEFGVGGAALPSEAANGLSKAARELRGSVALRIHIAGHVQSDEDPRLASQVRSPPHLPDLVIVP